VSRNRDQPWSYRYCEITLSCPARVRAQLTFRVGGIWELAELRYTLRRQARLITEWRAEEESTITAHRRSLCSATAMSAGTSTVALPFK
jgi:hypothetical protein